MIHYRSEGLKASDYEYEGDREALNALKKIPIMDRLIATYLDFAIKSGMFIKIKQNAFRVTAETYPSLYRLYQTCLDRLNMEKEPQLYIDLQYEYNAYAAGVDSPFIVLHSSLVNDCTEGELMALMGHELGHINSGHVLYQNLANSLLSLLTSYLKGLAPLISTSTMFALMDWQRKAEFTADRAGMIASGALQPSVDLLSRLMGRGTGENYVDFSNEALMLQYEDFDLSKDSVIGRLIYVSQTAFQSHPWTINRIKKLTEWEQSANYIAVYKETEKLLPHY